MSVNKVLLIGNVGKDPDIRYLDSGVAIARFPLATSETYKNREGEKITTTEWHNIVLWRALAEVAEKFVKKGTQLFIEGRIRTRSYDDKDGNKKYVTEIVADTMQMLGKKPGSESHEANSVSNHENDTEDKGYSNSVNKAQDDPQKKGTFDKGIIAGQDEDDLPF
jgi:single-strand DNA-binding protein